MKISDLFPGAWTPRSGKADGYPYDLDGSLRNCRFATGVDTFPWIGGDGTVAQIGSVSGFFPQQDMTIWYQMMGKMPFGPGVTTTPINLQWQMTVPGLSKVA